MKSVSTSTEFECLLKTMMVMTMMIDVHESQKGDNNDEKDDYESVWFEFMNKDIPWLCPADLPNLFHKTSPRISTLQ